MKPFAIAGIQMHLIHGSNIAAMRQRIDLTMHLYPWVQMVSWRYDLLRRPIRPAVPSNMNHVNLAVLLGKWQIRS